MADKRKRIERSNKGEAPTRNKERQQDTSELDPYDPLSSALTPTALSTVNNPPQTLSLPSQRSAVPLSPASSAKESPIAMPAQRPPQGRGQQGLGQALPGNPQGKIAIPRIRRGSDSGTPGSVASSDKYRVSHACEACRQRKVKCTGEKPTCRHCNDFKIQCVYADGKRDKIKRDHARLEARTQVLEAVLKELILQVNGAAKDIIQKALDDIPDHLSPPESAASSSVVSASLKRIRSVTGESDDEVESAGEESVVSGDAGSNELLSRLDEDLNRSERSRAIGYIGKNSEVQWLRRVQLEFSNTLDTQQAAGAGLSRQGQARRSESQASRQTSVQSDDTLNISDLAYYCDDLSVVVEEQVDPFELPPKDMAMNMYRTYLATVQEDFPIVGRTTFASQLKTYYQSLEQGQPLILPAKWRAILNLIFAIGAKNSHLVRAEWQGDDRDHMIYYTRARMLGLNGDTIVSHPDLQQIQIVGLLAFYYMTISQVSRAWIMSGLAIRYAYSLGLNIRNESESTEPLYKEMRVRVWWALYTLERLLAVMTGRPSSAVDDFISIPLPIPWSEEKLAGDIGRLRLRQWTETSSLSGSQLSSPRTGSGLRTTPLKRSVTAGSPEASPGSLQHIPPSHALYFYFRVRLARITERVLSSLFSGSARLGTWSGVQKQIGELERELEKWKDDLPPIFVFAKNQRTEEFRRERMTLSLFYWSTKILICRPCLCRLDRRIGKQSQASKDFNMQKARDCIYAAKALTDLFPNDPNPVGLYKVGPWWCLVHHMMQAVTTFLLELTYESCHFPDDVPDIAGWVKKVIRWLLKMGEENISARRAGQLSLGLFRKIAEKKNIDVSEFSYAQSSSAGDEFPGYVSQQPRFDHASGLHEQARGGYHVQSRFLSSQQSARHQPQTHSGQGDPMQGVSPTSSHHGMDTIPGQHPQESTSHDPGPQHNMPWNALYSGVDQQNPDFLNMPLQQPFYDFFNPTMPTTLYASAPAYTGTASSQPPSHSSTESYFIGPDPQVPYPSTDQRQNPSGSSYNVVRPRYPPT